MLTNAFILVISKHLSVHKISQNEDFGHPFCYQNNQVY